jgi:putative endonuclease
VKVKQYYVCIMSNRSRTIYTAVTNNLQRRVYEHKNQLIPGFTSKHRIDQLVYYEVTADIESAIVREKEIKSWLRSKKTALIEFTNPEWLDLSEGWSQERDSSLRSE